MGYENEAWEMSKELGIPFEEALERIEQKMEELNWDLRNE